jgi:spore coat polysaccharide biosynthesis protein SpsF (cytidylyltransferase family)
MKAIFITVRTQSTRLPNKALETIYSDVSVIQHIINRAKLSKLADEIILCTTVNVEDLVLTEIAEKNAIKFFQGPAIDKLERWNQATNKFNIEFFVTMDGDDPLCDPLLVDYAFEQQSKLNLDFIYSDDVIPGLFTYGIKSSALHKVCEIKDSQDTEMMWTYFRDSGIFKIGPLLRIPEAMCKKDIRLTLDYPEDLILFKRIFEHFRTKEKINTLEVINFLLSRPELVAINWFRNSQFLQNQKIHTKLVLKKHV